MYNISFHVKIRLYKSLILSILLYGFDSWTLIANIEHMIQAFENKSFRKILKMLYLEHKTNTYVKDKVIKYAGNKEHLITEVKRCKIASFVHVNRHDILSKTSLQSTVQELRRQESYGGKEVNERIVLTITSNGQNVAFLN
jgi:hypothetical protein